MITKQEARRLARWYKGIAADYAQAAARFSRPAQRTPLLVARAKAQGAQLHYEALAKGRRPHVSPTFTLE